MTTDSLESAEYEAIILGARCAGSPTAMLLAGNGYRVLLVDKTRFSERHDLNPLHHPPGVAALARWGILEQLKAIGRRRWLDTRSTSAR